MTAQRCNRYTDCASCEFYQEDVYKMRVFPKGMMIPSEKCLQNTICFLLSGEIWINSKEHPKTTLHAGQFLLQPICSLVEYHVREASEVLFYLFDHPLNVCDARFKKAMGQSEVLPPISIVMDVCPPMRLFIDGMKMFVEDDMLCSSFIQAKRVEMVHLLNSYYTLRELSAFYSPIYRYIKSFRYFVMQNYTQVKDVESFARLGGYSVSTFRRLFKETFDEPAYQWMLKQKCQDIYNDLIETESPISEICYKHGFESLSNFSHFCRSNFDKSPRQIRAEREM